MNDFYDGLATPFHKGKLKVEKPTEFDRYSEEVITNDLCPVLVKKWFGLKRHLRRNTHIEGYFNVSFTPIKERK